LERDFSSGILLIEYFPITGRVFFQNMLEGIVQGDGPVKITENCEVQFFNRRSRLRVIVD
jgi:hypothetical protein